MQQKVTFQVRTITDEKNTQQIIFNALWMKKEKKLLEDVFSKKALKNVVEDELK